MLNYQTTGYHETAILMRSLPLNKRPIKEFEEWMKDGLDGRHLTESRRRRSTLYEIVISKEEIIVDEFCN